ncbi:MAG: UTP--glucose-1-phosphate uridylyltransferase GalU [bacterium]|nr:MAG: UTP--glucose-1-phosphate uridylyltransferase GalU [bacterium]
MKVRKAVIPAAGLGTRFLPATKAIPKELMTLVDRPLISEVVTEAVKSGISDIIFVTARGKAAIEDYFDIDAALESHLEGKGSEGVLREIRHISRMVQVSSVRQKEPRGLGHAVLCAMNAVGAEPFAVILPDDLVDSPIPCLAQLAEVFGNTGKSVVALQEVPPEETHRYGIIEGVQTGPNTFRISRFVEKPPPGTAPSNLAVIGRYVLVPEIFPVLAGLEPGSGGEIQLTDALDRLAARDEVHGLVFDGIRHDAGDKLGFLKATVHYALKDESLGPPFMRYLLDTLAVRGGR